MTGEGNRVLARDLLVEGLAWLRASYSAQRFFVERDVVWSLQRWLHGEVVARDLGLTVRNDYGVEPGPRRSLSADIALVPAGASIPAAILEVKYEPSHSRSDIDPRKLPVIAWADVVADAVRVRGWVETSRAQSGLAICVDEGGLFAKRSLPEGGAWEHWGACGTTDLDVWVHVVDEAGAQSGDATVEGSAT